MNFEQVRLVIESVGARENCEISRVFDHASSKVEESSSSLHSPSVVLLCNHYSTAIVVR